jgi:hypothetical protein
MGELFLGEVDQAGSIENRPKGAASTTEMW